MVAVLPPPGDAGRYPTEVDDLTLRNPYEPPQARSAAPRPTTGPPSSRFSNTIPFIVGIAFVGYWIGGFYFFREWQLDLAALPDFKRQAQYNVLGSVDVTLVMFAVLIARIRLACIVCGFALIGLQISLSTLAVRSGMVDTLDAAVASVPISTGLAFTTWLSYVFCVQKRTKH
ncbi:hypothetical protein [Rhodopirellula halodulae]|uniref:hypothetical protein n=1 Tax=Rhodopirellula halodulae TaxID=2894198 RepID=UPI001E4B7E28|nr:hypothetical protein [Rhodopirellula sp. JC737]MCC9656716.1 hypothetical protein [Rhodopirellula sp. JC737]